MLMKFLEEQRIKDLFEIQENELGYDECSICKTSNVYHSCKCGRCSCQLCIECFNKIKRTEYSTEINNKYGFGVFFSFKCPICRDNYETTKIPITSFEKKHLLILFNKDYQRFLEIWLGYCKISKEKNNIEWQLENFKYKQFDTKYNIVPDTYIEELKNEYNELLEKYKIEMEKSNQIIELTETVKEQEFNLKLLQNEKLNFEIQMRKMREFYQQHLIKNNNNKIIKDNIYKFMIEQIMNLKNKNPKSSSIKKKDLDKLFNSSLHIELKSI